jgi:hypothetical protein
VQLKEGVGVLVVVADRWWPQVPQDQSDRPLRKAPSVSLAFNAGVTWARVDFQTI